VIFGDFRILYLVTKVFHSPTKKVAPFKLLPKSPHLAFRLENKGVKKSEMVLNSLFIPMEALMMLKETKCMKFAL
jgi:hypothetical protein